MAGAAWRARLRENGGSMATLLNMSTRDVVMCRPCRRIVDSLDDEQHWMCNLQTHAGRITVTQHAHDWRDATSPGDYLCRKCGAWQPGYRTPSAFGCIDVRPAIVPPIDTASSASRQHWIDTGYYLPAGKVQS